VAQQTLVPVAATHGCGRNDVAGALYTHVGGTAALVHLRWCQLPSNAPHRIEVQRACDCSQAQACRVQPLGGLGGGMCDADAER
jgi:hypothetical protein